MSQALAIKHFDETPVMLRGKWQYPTNLVFFFHWFLSCMQKANHLFLLPVW